MKTDSIYRKKIKQSIKILNFVSQCWDFNGFIFFLKCNNTHVRLCFRDTYNYLLLKLPTCISNRNYAEFRSELKSVLKSDVWVMEWSKIWKKWMHLLKHCEIGSVVIQFKITHKSIFL